MIGPPAAANVAKTVPSDPAAPVTAGMIPVASDVSPDPSLATPPANCRPLMILRLAASCGSIISSGPTATMIPPTPAATTDSTLPTGDAAMRAKATVSVTNGGPRLRTAGSSASPTPVASAAIAAWKLSACPIAVFIFAIAASCAAPSSSRALMVLRTSSSCPTNASPAVTATVLNIRAKFAPRSCALFSNSISAIGSLRAASTSPKLIPTRANSCAMTSVGARMDMTKLRKYRPAMLASPVTLMI